MIGTFGISPSASRLESSMRRWLKFNLVGIIGFGVQIGLLASLVRGLQCNYLLATLLAVEVTIMHNFVWHERFTWSARKASGMASQRLKRFMHFNLSNGAVSLAGNLASMWLLVGELGLPYLIGNALSVLACAAINFFLCDRWIFQPGKPQVEGLSRNIEEVRIP